MVEIIDFSAYRKLGENFQLESAMARHLARSTANEQSIYARRRIAEIAGDFRLFRGRENVKAAENLWRILEEVKAKHGKSRTDVAMAAFSMDENALKRLDKLTHQPEQNISRAKEKRLQRKPKLYLSVAQAAARLVGLDKDFFAARLFQDTPVAQAYLNPAEPDENEKIEWVTELARTLHVMAKLICEKTNLDNHLGRIATTAGDYRLWTGTIFPAQDALLKHGPSAWNFEVVDEYPPIPSIPLFRDLRVPSFFRSVGKEQVEVRAWREVRLAIGPGDYVDEPMPLFERRTVFSFRTEADGDLEVKNRWLYDDVESISFKRNEKWLQGDIDLRWPKEGDVMGFDDGDIMQRIPLDGPEIKYETGSSPLQPEHSYVTWLPVTENTCQMLLDLPARDRVRERDWLIPSPFTDNTPTLAPANTLAQMMERTLASANNEHSLFTRLLAETESMIRLVDNYAKDAKKAALERLWDAEQRWRALPKSEQTR